MHKKFLSKTVTLVLTASMLIVNLTGCGNTSDSITETLVDGSINIATTEASNDTDSQTTEMSNKSLGLLMGSNSADANTSVEFANTYNSTLTDINATDVFKFECSEAAGQVAYNTFKVYDNPNLEDISQVNYAKVTYKDGVLTVSPDDVILLTESGSKNASDGTWGSFEKLYLVQYVDLKTGTELAKPVVTPFLVKHDLATPAVAQTLDENNTYTLKWNSVPGADRYLVYEHYGDSTYDLVGITESTSITSNEFTKQQSHEDLMSKFKSDLSSSELDVVTTSGKADVNSGVKYDNNLKSGYFTVIAVGTDGKTSGASKLVDVREIANLIPYKVANSVIKVTLDNSVESGLKFVESIPAYADVEMIDGSTSKMVIDYHGAQTYKFTDNSKKIAIKAKVANTELESILVVATGVDYDTVMSEISYITEREDRLLSKTKNSETETVIIDTTADTEKDSLGRLSSEVVGTLDKLELTPEETNVLTSEAPVGNTTPEVVSADTPVENTETAVESTTAPTEVATDNQTVDTTDVSEPVKLAAYVVSQIDPTINTLIEHGLYNVLYSNSKMEEWIAYCLLGQSEIIPLPIETFGDEAADVEHAAKVLVEAYRQNPSTGAISNVKYNYEYQAFVVNYVGNENRLEKAIKELDAANKAANNIITPDMSDYDKVVAINNYLTDLGTYDTASAATEVDNNSLSEQFIDSHAPYGILCNGLGVCESYAEAFALVARFAGLNAVCEMGSAFGVNHEWARVQIDGAWYIIDVTNNDNEKMPNGILNYSDDLASGVLIGDGTAYLSNLEATSDRLEYYNVKGDYCDTVEAAVASLERQIDEKGTAVVRLNKDFGDAEVQQIAKKMVQEDGYVINDAQMLLYLLYLSK